MDLSVLPVNEARTPVDREALKQFIEPLISRSKQIDACLEKAEKHRRRQREAVISVLDGLAKLGITHISSEDVTTTLLSLGWGYLWPDRGDPLSLRSTIGVLLSRTFRLPMRKYADKHYFRIADDPAALQRFMDEIEE